MVASLGLLLFVHATDGLRTYYHFWGHNDRRRGDMKGAILHYGKVVRIDPSYASGALRLANSYRRAGKPEEALDAAEAGLRHHPEHFKLNRLAAELYDRAGDGMHAYQAAKRAAKARPGDARTQKLLRKWAAQPGAH